MAAHLGPCKGLVVGKCLADCGAEESQKDPVPARQGYWGEKHRSSVPPFAGLWCGGDAVQDLRGKGTIHRPGSREIRTDDLPFS